MGLPLPTALAIILAMLTGSLADKGPSSGSASLSQVSDYFDYYYPPDETSSSVVGSGSPAAAVITGRYNNYPSYAAPSPAYGPPDQPDYSSHGHGHGYEASNQWQPAPGSGKKYVASNPVVFPPSSSPHYQEHHGHGYGGSSSSGGASRPSSWAAQQPTGGYQNNYYQQQQQQQQQHAYIDTQQSHGSVIPPDVTGPFCGRFKCYGDEFCDVIDSTLMCVPNFCRDWNPVCPPGCGLSFKYSNRCPVCDKECVKNFGNGKEPGKRKHPCDNVICAHPSQICIEDSGKARCQIIPLNLCESVKCPLFEKCLVEDKTPVCRSWFWKPL